MVLICQRLVLAHAISLSATNGGAVAPRDRPGTARDFVIYRVSILFLLLIGQSLRSVAAQETADQIRQLRESISELKMDVKALGEQQQQIADQLKALNRLLTSGRAGAAHPLSTVIVRGETFKGDRAAHVAIIEYADFQCGFCAHFMRDTYPQIDDEYIKTGKVKFLFRDLPLHAHSISAARAARCADEQGKFWDMEENLFANQSALSEKEILSRVPSIGLDLGKFSLCFSSERYADALQASKLEAEKMGITGTPTFLIGTIDEDVAKIEQVVVGAYPYELFKSNIDDLLAKH